MSFEPRTTPPSSTDKHWILDEYGGYNRCIAGNGSVTSALPNCVGYAWGRFYEINGSCNCSTNNAKNWYGYTQDGYERGKTPQVGAVICWGHKNAAGHVGIVEKVKPDGSVLISDSSYNRKIRFRANIVCKPPDYYFDDGYIFQGFIYSPNYRPETKLDQFLKVAQDQIGKDGKWACSKTGFSIHNEWSCAFVNACAKEAGISNIIIPATNSSKDLISLGESKGMGMMYKGPQQGVSSTPRPGDIAVFATAGGYGKDNKVTLTTVGIVLNVSGDTVQIIEGNSRGRKVCKLKYSVTSSKDIHSYFRPDWTKPTSEYPTGLGGRLYTTENTREDATIREIGYIDKSIQPSIKSSDIKLSIVNYTTVLNAAFDVIVSSLGGVPHTEYDSSNLDATRRNVYKTLIGFEFKPAAAIAIMANIEQESHFNPSLIGDGGTSGGICQWHLGRFSKMKTFVGSDWRSDLSGQLDFLLYDLKENFEDTVYKELKDCPNNVIGAQDCAEVFCRIFEVPADIEDRVSERRQLAIDFWNKLVPHQKVQQI